jgi:Cu+-exporting ATPase
MDVLVSIATNVAYFYSAILIAFCMLVPDCKGANELASASVHFLAMGPILIAIVLFGKYLEAHAKLKAMQTLTDLPASRPETATLCSNGKGEMLIPVEQVELGDIIRVFAGGKVAVDGIVCSESTLHVDESLLTGESKPVGKSQGDLILGGTTCVTGGCLMRVTKVGRDTTLGQMELLVQEAQASKAGIQRVADRVARIFVPSVVSLALITFLIWSGLVFGGIVNPDLMTMHHHSMPEHHQMHGPQDMQDTDLPGSLKLLFAVKFGMAVLMIACPCAMGLATPMAIMVATGVAAKRGCLVKSAAALETAACVTGIVLDKTGTITQGSPAIHGAICTAASFRRHQAAWAAGPGKQHIGVAREELKGTPQLNIIGSAGATEAAEVQRFFWWLLGILESASDHPVAKCILSSVHSMQDLPPIMAPKDFEYISGRGVRCKLEEFGGAQARVGNMSFFEDCAVSLPEEVEEAAELRGWVSASQAEGHTVVFLHLDGVALGAVALRDPVREEAPWVIKYLTEQLGLEVWLCTGDNSATAQSVARAVGITNVVAEALPGTKSECVKQLQQRDGKHRICFVGDGINDSPALAQADIGIAIGVGAQIAVEAAEVALVRAELRDLVSMLALSRTTVRTIFLNFFWAFCFNFVCLPVAAGVFYPYVYIRPLAAGIGMASSSCLVVFSSLLIQTFRPPSEQSWCSSSLWDIVGVAKGRHLLLSQDELQMDRCPSQPETIGKVEEP